MAPLRALRALLGATLVVACATTARAQILPPDFTVENAVPGVTFVAPTGMAYLPDGRFIVIEKGGTAWMVRNGVRLPNPVWSAPNEVLDSQDRGFLGVAVDPNYFVNHYVYFLYTVDPDTNGVDDPDLGFGRLTRYTMNTTGDTNRVNLSTRTILMGVDWTRGPLIASLSHTIGSLRFARDGSLLVSAGDGANFTEYDFGGQYPLAFGPGRTDPNEDIGAYRAQDITSLCGKILRLNPANGHGYASNPFATADLTATRSKVYAYGLRNPFRFSIRPGTGSTNPAAGNPGMLMVGDVGWFLWEELSVVTAPGQNMAWPCFEGFESSAGYQSGTPAHNGCGSVGTPTNPSPFRMPVASWNHEQPSLSVPPGFTGNSSVAGVFYGDTLYPASWRGRFFSGDYGGGWIKAFTFDAVGNLLAIQGFGTEMGGPVDFALAPDNGDLMYVAIGAGEVRRIRYNSGGGGNTPPVAVASGTPTTGTVPLTVNFSSAGSFDPDGDPITYSWTFGDGGSSTQPNPSHTYQSAGPYTAILTVDDGRGGQDVATVGITVGTAATFPTTGVLDPFTRANGALGGAWVGQTGAMVVLNNTMRQTGPDATMVWAGGQFGPSQEVHIRMDAVTPSAPEVDLMLKVQGLSWDTGHIEVKYEAPFNRVAVSTYHPIAGWQGWGLLTGTTFNAGDTFGARAMSNGLVEVFRNGVSVGQVSVSGWAFASQGGYLGMTIAGANATIFDDFGGGNWTPQNQPPTVTVLSPNGGESWVGGSAHAITWNAVDDLGVSAVDVFYRESANVSWTPIAANLPNTGTWTWFVHNTPGTGVRVKVTARDASGAVGADSSNANLTITATPGGRVPTTLRDFFMPGTQPVRGVQLQTHNACMSCHGGYDANVEPGRNFRGTLMAQAARDPLFHACLAIAEQDAPSSGDLCIRCHSPGAWLAGRSQPTSGAGMTAADRDGVNCDFCHRLVDPIANPGNPPEDAELLAALLPAHRPTTYSNGQYVLDTQSRRRGPFQDPATPHSFLYSPFHSRSELCATCHDVSNPVFHRVGALDYAAGPFDTPADSITSSSLMPLERTYSEWLNSDYPTGVYAPAFAGNNPGGMVSSCQDCHVRKVTGRGCSDGTAPIRSDLPLHDMTGGNAWMGNVIGSLYPGETDAGALADAAARATAMLRKAATLDLSVSTEGDSFRATARVTNHTGHKLPTGYPEGRRMWIHVVARNAGGTVLAEWGHYDPATGVLSENAGTRVYEAVLGLSPALAAAIGLAPGPSFHFALNDTLYKDNRIPPAGFTNAAFASFGGTPVDPSVPGPRYADGQNWDLASWALPAGTRSVSARLFYQSTSKEYVEFLHDENVTNTAGTTLRDAWIAHGRSAPVAMASDSTVLDVLGGPGGRPPAALALRAMANPYRGPLELVLALPERANVTMDVMDVAGRRVRRIERGEMPPGEHRLTWDGRDGAGRDAGAGVFWAVLHADARTLTRRTVRLR